jgi:hypothetical protein
MNGWIADKVTSDVYLPEIKAILGRELISEAPILEDQERGTDLMVLTLAPFRVACRIRRHAYLSKYPGEFTLRAGRPSGFKTELAKIVEGWGDYFFYGFGNEDGSRLSAWKLADLKVFRYWHMRHIAMHNGTCPGNRKHNGDNSSFFMAYEWKWLPEGFVIASSESDA